jgi:hypothetical protein
VGLVLHEDSLAPSYMGRPAPLTASTENPAHEDPSLYFNVPTRGWSPKSPLLAVSDAPGLRFGQPPPYSSLWRERKRRRLPPGPGIW